MLINGRNAKELSEQHVHPPVTFFPYSLQVCIKYLLCARPVPDACISQRNSICALEYLTVRGDVDLLIYTNKESRGPKSAGF